MPVVRKIKELAREESKPKGNRGRPKGSKNGVRKADTEAAPNNKMYTFRCPDGCVAKFISKNVEANCGPHRKWMELVEK